MKNLLLVILFSSAIYGAVSKDSTKIYVIYTYKYNERVIEKIFLRKENAQKYCDTYKESHNYTFEEMDLTE